MASPIPTTARPSLSSETYAEIRQALLQGIFKPGQAETAMIRHVNHSAEAFVRKLRKRMETRV